MLTPANAGELAALVADAFAHGTPLRPQGAGTWLDAGHALPGALPLSLAAIRGVVSYTPDDLTMTVEGGTTLREIDEATGERGQWCPLLPWGGDEGTVGATVATATTGPFATTLGRPRDLVLGMDAVDGTGRTIAAGGRVVKNVAGFDLTRAFTGSWGTLAVITRLHLRLRARPAVDESWAVAAPDDTLLGFTRGPLAPLAAERLTAEEAREIGLDHARFLVRLGGNASFVTAARITLRTLGDAHECATDRWDRLRVIRSPEATATQWRWNALAHRLKNRFDPKHVLNAGLLGELS